MSREVDDIVGGLGKLTQMELGQLRMAVERHLDSPPATEASGSREPRIPLTPVLSGTSPVCPHNNIDR